MVNQTIMVIKIIDWETESLEYRALRRSVFIDEQHVPEADEWDQEDATAVHFVYTPSTNAQTTITPISCKTVAPSTTTKSIGTNLNPALPTNQSTPAVIACARLLRSGQIGRVAVAQGYRQRGIGHKLMRHVINYALLHNYPTPFLHAQVHTLDFYSKLGFVVCGERFMDAGIEHQAMTLML